MRTGGVLLLTAAMLIVVIVTGEPLLIAVILPFLVNLVSSWADRILIDGLPPLPRPPRWLRLPRFSRIRRPRHRISVERLLKLATVVLLIIGAAMVTSAVTPVPGEVGGEQARFYLARFLLFGGIGLILMYPLARVRLTRLKELSTPLLGVSLLLLTLTLVPGIGVGTPTTGQRWIGWGIFELEPSELTKLALVLYAAKSLAERQAEDNFASPVRRIAILTTASCLLIATEPDLGAALVVAFSIVSVLFAASIPTRRIAAAIGPSLCLLAIPIVFSGVGRSRVAAFLNPWGNEFGSSFQAVQGLIALGSGGLFGRGYGNSVQKAFYLPDAHTTFILAVIGEELGAIGVCVVLLLFAVIAYAGLRTAQQAEDGYSRNLGVGLTILVVGQCLLNAYWVLGLAPATDVGMPLVSYGLSSLLVTLATIGLLLNLARRQRVGEATPASWVVGGTLAVRSRVGMRRVGLAFAVLLMLLSIGVGRALWLGVVDAAELRQKASEQQNERVQIPAHRGTIYDRRGTALAVSKAAANVLFIPKYLEKSDLPKLDRRLTAVEQARLRRFPSSDADSQYLLNDVSRKRGSSFQYSHLHAVGVFDVPTFRREHPEGNVAAGLLGEVDREDDGCTGLEKALQQRLGGENGERDVLLNGLGKPVGGDVLDTPEAGKDVHLTIDTQVQAMLEDRLAKGSAGPANAESAVILDAHSGQILAMADAPVDTVGTVGAVGRAFEPGSALDAFTMAAALEEGVVTPTETFVLPPAIGSLAIDDGEEEAGTRLSSRQILAQSNDPGTVLVALRLGPSRFDSWMRRFGFGRRTGVELPAERSGLIPSVQASSMATMGSAPVGRGASVTLVQLAAAYASLFNGGRQVDPTLVMARSQTRHRLLAPVVSLEAAGALQGGSGGEVPQISAGTGTYSSNRADASFVGYVPRSDSMLIVAVFVEAPLGSGESSAQRIFASLRSALASPG